MRLNPINEYGFSINGIDLDPIKGVSITGFRFMDSG